MIILKFLTIVCCLVATPLISDEAENLLMYGGGEVQVTAELSPYVLQSENTPIIGTIMITHNEAAKVDNGSFQMGSDSLQVQFVKDVPLSSYGNLVISIYQFQMKGMKKGIHNLPSITVKVGGKEYTAPPLTVAVGA